MRFFEQSNAQRSKKMYGKHAMPDRFYLTKDQVLEAV